MSGCDVAIARINAWGGTFPMRLDGQGGVSLLFPSPHPHPGHLRCADPPLPPLARGARKGVYVLKKIIKNIQLSVWRSPGIWGLPHGSEAEAGATNQDQTMAAWNCFGTASNPIARHDKQGIRSAVPTPLDQQPGVTVALGLVKNTLATGRAEVNRNGGDDDAIGLDIFGYADKCGSIAASALHRDMLGHRAVTRRQPIIGIRLVRWWQPPARRGVGEAFYGPRVAEGRPPAG